MDVSTLRAAMQPTYLTDPVLRDYLPHFEEAMRAANINTVNRAAAWCSQLGHESGGLRYMSEIETSNPNWNADRTRYRGRGPIQLTWESNYRKFGQWCKAAGYVTDAETFVKNPELVEQPKWGFLAASWYWLNGGPRPGQINTYADNGDILAVSRCVNGWVEGKVPNGYTDRLARWNRCLAMGDALIASGTTQMEDDMRPDFNEFPIWSSNYSPRGGTKPDCFFLHTSEGFVGNNAAAEQLSLWYQSANNVSYHYAVSQASDGGVTVVDNVDTDFYSWSVLSANRRSINLCFAGTQASWTREQWLARFGNAIDVAAYLAVQDAKKYGFPTTVVAPPYKTRIPGISDHRYVTKVLGDGTHTDVGDGFPWDVFAAAVKKYTEGEVPAPTPEPAPPSEKKFPADWSDRDLLVEIVRQLRGPTLKGWPQLDGRTLIDAVAELLPDVSQDSKNAA